VDKECKGCVHIRYCRGGCPYNAIAPTEGQIRGVDPHCVAYRRIFDEITNRFNREMMGLAGLEMSSPQSEAVKQGRPGMMSLMRKIISS